MNYYYAYHGPKNDGDFNWRLGYGVASKSKRDKVAVGSQVIVIQKPDKANEFRLCGVFRVVKHYDDMTSAFPYRFELNDVSKLPGYIVLNDIELSDALPTMAGGNRGWSNFQKHFCAQGITFQRYLAPEVTELLLSQIGFHVISYGSILEDFRRKVISSLKSSPEERHKRLRSARAKPKQKIVSIVVYNRNPDVVAEVLYEAKGQCEACFEMAPFNRKSDGSPFLEVHHKVPLAQGGDDTVENAIALCPNCHRKTHYG